MRKIYKYKNCYYELKTKGTSMSTFYVLDENKQRIRNLTDVSNRNKQRYGLIPDIYKTIVSGDISKFGELQQESDNQEKLF